MLNKQLNQKLYKVTLCKTLYLGYEKYNLIKPVTEIKLSLLKNP